MPVVQQSPTLDPQAAETPPLMTDAGSPAPTFDPGSTIDALDAELAALDQYLNGLDRSLSDSDGQAYGGE